jgi:hypothetical protein
MSPCSGICCAEIAEIAIKRIVRFLEIFIYKKVL